jgi:hypothetical protein
MPHGSGRTSSLPILAHSVNLGGSLSVWLRSAWSSGFVSSLSHFHLFILRIRPIGLFKFGIISEIMNHLHTVGLLGRVIRSSQGLYLHRKTQHRHTRTNIHALSWIRTRDPVYGRSRPEPQTARPLDRHLFLLYCFFCWNMYVLVCIHNTTKWLFFNLFNWVPCSIVRTTPPPRTLGGQCFSNVLGSFILLVFIFLFEHQNGIVAQIIKAEYYFSQNVEYVKTDNLGQCSTTFVHPRHTLTYQKQMTAQQKLFASRNGGTKLHIEKECIYM